MDSNCRLTACFTEALANKGNRSGLSSYSSLMSKLPRQSRLSSPTANWINIEEMQGVRGGGKNRNTHTNPALQGWIQTPEAMCRLFFKSRQREKGEEAVKYQSRSRRAECWSAVKVPLWHSNVRSIRKAKEKRWITQGERNLLSRYWD